MKAKGLFTMTLAALLFAPLWADTLTLKDGTKHEGKLVLELEDKVLFNVQVTDGLKEERTFNKSDIEKLVQSTPADLKFEEISTYVPTPDRLPLSTYRSRVTEVKKFLNAFKLAKNGGKARAILKELEAELELVEAGGLKVDGHWLTKEEVDANAYEIDAQGVTSEMADFVEKGSALGALRKYEELKKKFPGTAAFRQAIPQVKKVLEDYEAAIKLDLSTLESRIETREKEFNKLGATQKREAMEQVEDNSMVYKKRLDFEKQKQMKWMTLNPYHKGPMDDALRNIEKERESLDKVDLSKLPDASGLYRTAWEAASANNRTRVEELAPDLKAAGIQVKHFKLLQDRLKQKEAEAAAAEESLPSQPETPVITEPETDDVPAEASNEEDATGEEMPEEETTVSSEDEEESSSALRPILFGIIGLVVVVALVVVLTGKKK